jgi:hypothetical protein
VKVRIVLGLFVLGAMVALSMFYLFGSAGAATTGTVTPSVTVESTLSLTLENGTNVQWGSQTAGTTHTGTIQAFVVANTGWKLTVRRTSDVGTDYGLKGADLTNHIPSSNFTFTSVQGSPAPSGSGVTSPTEFPHASNADVWTNGTAALSSRVAVTYSLSIPANQYPQGYSATHTYTLSPS